MKKLIGLLAGVFLALTAVNTTYAARESNIPFSMTASDGQSTDALQDKNRRTSNFFAKGSTLTITSEIKIHGIYIEMIF